MSRDEDGYSFEDRKNPFRTGSRRGVKDATREWKVLLARICGKQSAAVEKRVQDSPGDPRKELWHLLEHWAVECPLNVAWYARMISRRRAIWIAANGLVLLVSGGGMIGAVVLALSAYDSAKPPNAAIALGALLSFVLAALFGLLRLIAGIADVKQQYGLFWEANAALKEDLFGFEDAWSERTSQDSEIWERDATNVELRAALREQIRRARAHVAKEKAAFFKTFKSPQELVEAAAKALEENDARVQKWLAARQPLATGGAASPNEAEEALDAVKAAQRAEDAASRVAALEVELERFRFAQASSKTPDPALEAEVARKELEVAHALERLELSRCALERIRLS